MRRRVLAAAAVIAALLLTGCTEQADLPQVTLGPGVLLQEYAPGHRKAISFDGPLAGGGTFRSADHRGSVLVVNFWYSTCGPCNAEAPVLKQVQQQFAGKKVQFVGINTQDDVGGVRDFDTEHGLRYPTILDASSGAAQLAFARTGVAKPGAIPSTVVIDPKGRVSALFTSQLPKNVLPALIDTALETA